MKKKKSYMNYFTNIYYGLFAILNIFLKKDDDIDIPIDALYKNIKDFYEKYRDIGDLLNYQKILLIIYIHYSLFD